MTLTTFDNAANPGAPRSVSPPAPMRLAVVIERLDPAAGGGAQSTLEIAEQLAARGHDVTVLAGSARPGVGVEGAAVRAMAGRRSFSAARLLRFAAWAECAMRHGFDAGLSMTAAVPATLVLPRGGVTPEAAERYAALGRSGAGRAWRRAACALSPRQQCLSRLERRTASHPGVWRFVAHSPYLRAQLTERLGVERDRVALIPAGASVPAASAPQRAAWREQVRGAFSVAPRQTLYLFAARQPRLRGFDTLVDAVRRLAHQGGDPVVLVVGAAGYAQQAAVERAGQRGRFRFVGPTRRMGALYAAADATVLPTYYDPASRVVLESLAMGTPAITTRYDGASDRVRGGGSGPAGVVLDDPGDAAALAEAMAAAADPGQRSAWVAALASAGTGPMAGGHAETLEGLLAGLDAAGARVPAA